ncbi:cyclopropane-fatty-acyl-phospholipid synthase family protein [Lutimaribacter sp. EGI FJ00015]|uniref:Cyclopropane-fatty-acyl-phospholipid synthase family protein n=1 Tax=Lutimaribacter degradans TaxID=2945989 RepID=A0ACC5ZTC9_9RHOB|nr:cyclopropane-fatty-acyl-phospholipid synthase family protein [Lutimaribacter sp. EGI FJ00013]MCM2561608.1 cyclopropane-fatty-acyl-phospholipid synthase family protein [Lutimaribacter sp. EGI FJ00013]MCO0612681.1 cyclopropane-fatty-acyl-phospholipid synthase family protein [Lutimaribacter sp. EGI FJ00015]MCO0635339.1 cyclopropane-fatty-acyl-phospholipid synthase family protein [Lutimaribacter sp. EGI FJ00014]
MWTQGLDRLLSHLVRHGELSVTYPDGTTRVYGSGTPRAAVTLHAANLPRRLVLTPHMAMGEAYMDGELTIEDDGLRSFIDLITRNAAQNGLPGFHKPVAALRRLGRRLAQFNPAARAQRNVAHHYDLSGELYDLFLDDDRQYSCAYFARPDMTLDEAQEAKKQHIARKLRIEPGMRVLDIGCGWGGMGLTLARDFGAHVTGVTLSREQHAMANARAAEAGLTDRAQFHLMDYRDITGPFDRIVSVGMFEHVGVPHYHEYFSKVHDLLSPDGIALIHTIGRTTPPGATSPWITKYIFPGGYCPALSETVAAIEPTGLGATDIEVWRLHYAETLKEWHARFVANEKKARALYDERFCRMWRFYLLASEFTFRNAGQVVFQLQLTKAQDAVPLTRDYLYPAPSPEKRPLAAE